MTARSAFTLVEMLVVIAIISILMTLGSIGLSSIGGKGVAGGVSTAEALFDEARNNAVGRNMRAAVLVAKTLTNNPADDLRRIVVAYENTSADGETFKNPDGTPIGNPDWVLSSRGALLPEKTFFSEEFSKRDHSGSGGDIRTISHTKLKLSPSGPTVKSNYHGEWFIYEFNSQGICTTPGASFIICSGSRNLDVKAPSEVRLLFSSGSPTSQKPRSGQLSVCVSKRFSRYCSSEVKAQFSCCFLA